MVFKQINYLLRSSVLMMLLLLIGLAVTACGSGDRKGAAIMPSEPTFIFFYTDG